jgi:hypothetical protein
VIELVNRNTAADMLGLSTFLAPKVLGHPDAMVRWGISDCPVWRIERITELRLGHKCQFVAPVDLPELFTLAEGARLTGISSIVCRPRMPRPCAVLTGREKPVYLWHRQTFIRLRRAIQARKVKVQARAIRRFADGVTFAPPRHTLADQSVEQDRIQKLRPRPWRLY